MFDYGCGIYGVDAHYNNREGTAEIYIIRSEGHAAIIETAHNDSMPYALEAMKELGIGREDVDYIFVTHVHLDHAGGAGLYMREFPKARLVVHPRGARHMIDPTRLIESAGAVYGERELKKIYGEILPVPADRVVAPNDPRTFHIGTIDVISRYAPGHAKHHMIFFEKSTKSIFTGDAFGISYPWMKGERGRWSIPTSAPVQFDPEAMLDTIDKIVALKPKLAFLTHFGTLTDVCWNAELQKAGVKRYVEIAKTAKGDKEGIAAGLASYYRELISEYGADLPAETIERSLPTDLELSSQGLSFWYKTRRS